MEQPGDDRPEPAGLKGVGIHPVLQPEVVKILEIPEEDGRHPSDRESNHHHHKY